MADPYFSSVVLLLNFQGSDASTTLTDESDAPKTVTAQANAQIDTSDGDFSGGAMQLDGTGDKAYVSAPASTDSDFLWGTGDFTLETSIKTTSAEFMVFEYWKFGYVTSWYLYVNASGYLEWRVVNGSGTQIVLAASSGAVNTGVKTHLAVSRVSGTLYLLAAGAVLTSIADATNYVAANQTQMAIGGYSGASLYEMNGRFGPTRVTKGVGRYSGTYTAPAGLFDTSGAETVSGYAAAGSMLGVPALRGHLLSGHAAAASPLGAAAVRGHRLFGHAAAASMLGAVTALGVHDFTGQIDPASPARYVVDLVTPGGLVRVPISSWQATLQTDEAQYSQCVVPAATDWVADIEAATEFVVSRVALMTDGSTLEYEMTRAPVQTVALDRGSRNYTATLSGYTDALEAVVDPDTAHDRTLANVRSISLNSGLTRVRCDVDWLLRPGHRAYLDVDPLIVSYLNIYVQGTDQYMDVGDRV